MNSHIKQIAAAVFAVSAVTSIYAEIKADSLLSVDQNRTEIVEGLVAKWKDHLVSGKESDLKQTLMSLRADKLLAVSLAQDQKQFAALLEKDDFLPLKEGSAQRVQAKALGDPNTDVVYVPVTPCRLFYTEIASGGAGGALLPGVTRTFSTRGSLTGQGGAAGCSVPSSATAIVLQMGAFSSFGLGWINAGPQGSPIPTGVLLAYNNVAFINATSVTLKINPTNGQFSAFSNNTQTELYGDVLGYFARPTNYADNITFLGNPVASTINGGRAHTINNAVAGTIAGGQANTLAGTSTTIGGGSSNEAGGSGSTIAGGVQNTSISTNGAIGGGTNNTASGNASAIAGGITNSATGTATAVAGGQLNVASGLWSMIAGGRENAAAGDYSFAAGRKAQTTAAADGSFVWADGNDLLFTIGAPNRFEARATGGVRFVSAIAAGTGVATAGVELAAGGGSWTSVSDVNAKTAFAKVDVRDVLAKVVALPISTWQYKSQAASIRHIGPISQDFKRMFGVGETDKGITAVDADGVALAAIQGLNQKLNQAVKDKDAKIGKLERELAAIKRKLGL